MISDWLAYVLIAVCSLSLAACASLIRKTVHLAKGSVLAAQLLNCSILGGGLAAAELESIVSILVKAPYLETHCTVIRSIHSFLLMVLSLTGLHISISLIIAMLRCRPWVFRTLRYSILILWLVAPAILNTDLIVHSSIDPATGLCSTDMQSRGAVTMTCLGLLNDLLIVVYSMIICARSIQSGSMPFRVRSRHMRRAGAIVLSILVCFGWGVACMVPSLQQSLYIQELLQISMNSYCSVVWLALHLLDVTDSGNRHAIDRQELAFDSHISAVSDSNLAVHGSTVSGSNIIVVGPDMNGDEEAYDVIMAKEFYLTPTTSATSRETSMLSLQADLVSG